MNIEDSILDMILKYVYMDEVLKNQSKIFQQIEIEYMYQALDDVASQLEAQIAFSGVEEEYMLVRNFISSILKSNSCFLLECNNSFNEFSDKLKTMTQNYLILK